MRHDGDLRFADWFCGAGGSTQGAASIPGVQPVHAANHWARAIESHAANFPDADHWRGDIRDLDVARLPDAEIFWASPECTTWSKARGKGQDYAVTDTALPGMEDPAPAEEVERSRALMEEVPQYLRAMALRGRPVLAGVVENVIDIRDWTDWGRWRTEIEAVGYRTRLIALNSMHAQSVRTPRAPQSRDRLYLAYWHVSLGRDPDWDKWLRPAAWCPTCEEWVSAVQVFKDPSRDMGRYRSQYVYRCPRISCRNAVVEPAFLPAYTAIDWTLRGERIGDRTRPLAPKTMARIAAGIRRYARPIHVEAAGNTYDGTTTGSRYYRAWPVEEPLKALTTTATKAVVVPPILVPVEGRERLAARAAVQALRSQTGRSETALVTVPPLLVQAGGSWNDEASPVTVPMRARTTRESEALVVAPFIAELRGGGSVARPLAEALATVTASGNHHGLTVPASWDKWAALYAYDSGVRDLLAALPTQTTVEGDALITGSQLPAVEDCLFRMLEPDEILRGMAFARDYIVLGTRRERVRQAGNAVTPPAAEVIVSALVECITGEDVASGPKPAHERGSPPSSRRSTPTRPSRPGTSAGCGRTPTR
jgi:DNA (cytosine-5)-methyltransferase 1